MKQPLVNTLGAFGYSSVLVQYLWTIITIGLPLLTSDMTKRVFLPQEPTEPAPTIDPISLPGFVEQIIVVASVIFAVAIILYAIVAVPRGIGRAGQRITRTSAQTVSTGVQRHRHQPMGKKHKRRLVSRFTWSFKYALAIIPLFLLIVPVDPSIGLEQAVVIVVGLVAGGFSLLWFTLQYSLARLWHIGARDIW